MFSMRRRDTVRNADSKSRVNAGLLYRCGQEGLLGSIVNSVRQARLSSL